MKNHFQCQCQCWVPGRKTRVSWTDKRQAGEEQKRNSMQACNQCIVYTHA